MDMYNKLPKSLPLIRQFARDGVRQLQDGVDWHHLYHSAHILNCPKRLKMLDKKFGKDWNPSNKYFCKKSNCYIHKQLLKIKEQI